MSIRKGTKVIAEVADSSTFAKNSEVVKLSGNQEINNTKTFNSTIFAGKAGTGINQAIRYYTLNQQSTSSPSSVQTDYFTRIYDKSGNDYAEIKLQSGSENQIHFMLKSKDNGWKTVLSMRTTSTGSYTIAPTVVPDTNSDAIATTKWVRTFLRDFYRNGYRCAKFDLLHTGTVGSGNITLSKPYTDYQFLLVSGCHDNGTNRHSLLIPSFVINKSRAWNVQWLLWHNGSGNYWYLSPSSTETTFICGAENSIIDEIVGISFQS